MDGLKGVGALDWGLLQGSVGPRVRLLRNLLYARSLSESEPFGLPMGSLTIMSLISANSGSSQRQLAHWSGITGPGLVAIVDELEERKLVTRERDANDRRRNMIVLSAKGVRTLETMFEVVNQIEAPLREALGPEEMAQLIDLVERSITALRQDEH